MHLASERTVREPSKTRCHECGVDGYEIDWRAETRARVLELGVCLHCLHWLEVVEAKEMHVVVPCVDARGGPGAYAHRPKADEPELRARTGGWGLGCGGTAHYFVLADGTLLLCRNVWNRGDVPPHFRERLPVNARVATLEERESLDWSQAFTHLPRTLG
jgi:hypothetical protein